MMGLGTHETLYWTQSLDIYDGLITYYEVPPVCLYSIALFYCRSLYIQCVLLLGEVEWYNLYVHTDLAVTGDYCYVKEQNTVLIN